MRYVDVFMIRLCICLSINIFVVPAMNNCSNSYWYLMSSTVQQVSFIYAIVALYKFSNVLYKIVSSPTSENITIQVKFWCYSCVVVSLFVTSWVYLFVNRLEGVLVFFIGNCLCIIALKFIHAYYYKLCGDTRTY